MKQLILIVILFTVALVIISAAKESETIAQSNFPGWYFNPNFLQLMKQYAGTSDTIKKVDTTAIMRIGEIDLRPIPNSPVFLKEIRVTKKEG